MRFLVIFLLFSTSFSAQILDKFPKGQDFYQGGKSAFYKDAQEFVSTKKIAKCPNDQIYYARFIVTSDKQEKFVKDFDEENIKKNQCAYDLTLNIFKNLKNWSPAIVEGKATSSEAEFIIYPDDFFNNSNPEYNFYENYIPAKYKKGNERLKKDFHDNFQTLFNSYYINADFVLDFYVDANGKIVDPDVHPKIEDRNFANDFLRTLKWMDGKFTPATYKGIPVKQRFTVPMSFNTKIHAPKKLH